MVKDSLIEAPGKFVASFAFAVVLVGSSYASAQFGLRPVQPKNQFYRFKASYAVLATNESVDFDLVRPCRVTMARDMNNDSVALPPSKLDPDSYFYDVESFPKVTVDGHAIVVHIPASCNGATTANGKVPADLLPFATWFEDADDLSLGWLYASADAYKSSLAKVRFNGASIEAATEDDFKEWQKLAPNGFRASKVVRHPFGFTNLQYRGGLLPNQPYHFAEIPSDCYGVRRLTLPPEIGELARAAWPEGRPRFWMMPRQPAKRMSADAALYKSIWSTEAHKYRFNGGNDIRAVQWGIEIGNGPISVPTAKSGAIFRPQLRPADLFPLVYAPYAKPFLDRSRLVQQNYYMDIDVSPQMKGFLACYSDGWIPTNELRAEENKHFIIWRMSGDLIYGQWSIGPVSPQKPSQIFEMDEFVYEEIRGRP